jgi:hypothetical protein
VIYILHICSWGGKYKYICLQPLAKAKADRDAGAEGPFTGADSHHLTTAKRLWTFSKKKECTGTYFAYSQYGAHVNCAPYCEDAKLRIFFESLSLSGPVYGFWYYFIMHRGRIGTQLQRILPKFIPRTAAEVD